MTAIPHSRPIRSFVSRQRRLRAAKQKIFNELWSKYGVEPNQLLNFEALFGNSNPVVLEIGFGGGESLFYMAQNYPEKNFIGIEVHVPGIALLLERLNTTPLNNIKIISGDAAQLIPTIIPDNSLEQVLLFFPDPWPKKRHHKRRLVQIEFINLIYQKLKASGIFHVATDWEDYAKHVLEIMSKCAGWQNCGCERPAYRTLTKFENRGLKLNHRIWDILFIKIHI